MAPSVGDADTRWLKTRVVNRLAEICADDDDELTNYTDAMLMTKDDYDHYYDEYCCFDLAVSLADHLFRLLCYAKRGSGNPYHPMLLET